MVGNVPCVFEIIMLQVLIRPHVTFHYQVLQLVKCQHSIVTAEFN